MITSPSPSARASWWPACAPSYAGLGAEPLLDVLRVGELTLDRERYVVSLPGREETLTPTEFEILLHAGQPAGRIFTRSQLLERGAWGGFRQL